MIFYGGNYLPIIKKKCMNSLFLRDLSLGGSRENQRAGRT